MRTRASLAFLFSFAMACGSPDDVFVGELTAPVVYGADDRLEVFEEPDADLQRIAEESIVALIPNFRINREQDGTYGLYTESLETLLGLCPDQRFGWEPTAAACSGVLIDDDLVLTAGHCIDAHTPCDSYSYVFHYELDAPDHLAVIRDEDVYSCAKLVAQGNPQGSDLTPDFSVIQLDRPVEGAHAPALIRPAAPLDAQESLTMIGFGTGLPAKIDSGGSVADPRADKLDFFVANVDAFQGHSGSATFDSQHELAGILIGGRTPDYVTSAEGCAQVNVYQNSQAGEVVHNIAPIVDALCTQGWKADNLCDPKACAGAPCGRPSTLPGGSDVVPVPSSKCSASRDSEGFVYGWLGLLLFVVARRFRRQAD